MTLAFQLVGGYITPAFSSSRNDSQTQQIQLYSINLAG